MHVTKKTDSRTESDSERASRRARDYIEEVRAEHGLTGPAHGNRSELARILGVVYATLAKWEAEPDRLITRESVLRLAAHRRIDRAYFYGDEEPSSYRPFLRGTSGMYEAAPAAQSPSTPPPATNGNRPVVWLGQVSDSWQRAQKIVARLQDERDAESAYLPHVLAYELSEAADLLRALAAECQSAVDAIAAAPDGDKAAVARDVGGALYKKI